MKEKSVDDRHQQNLEVLHSFQLNLRRVMYHSYVQNWNPFAVH